MTSPKQPSYILINRTDSSKYDYYSFISLRQSEMLTARAGYSHTTMYYTVLTLCIM